MNRIIISGCNGKMGHFIASGIKTRCNCLTVAGIDLKADDKGEFPVFSSPKDVICDADVLIDFSNPSLLPALLDFGLAKKIPLVLCTTGYTKEQVQQLTRASEEIPIFYSGNMSLGINLLIGLAKKAAALLGGQFDIEIIEKHHNQKLDAPSGTALMLADGISSVLDHEMRYTYDRHSQRKKREPNEIGIHSIRGGTIVGEHEVIFAGHDEVITLSHSAQSKEIFATGSINAALFLIGKKPGLYNMSDLIDQKED